MNTKDVFAVSAAIIASFGGAGVVLLGLSGFVGRVWADRLMTGEKARYDRELERLRAELTAANTSQLEHFRAELEVAKAKTLGAHADKLLMYRMVTDIVAEMLADLGAAFGGGRVLSREHVAERLHRFDRERIRAFGYLAMLAPQDVLDAYNRIIDHLLAVLEGTSVYNFEQSRELGIAMLNEIRKDLGVDASAIAYRGIR